MKSYIGTSYLQSFFLIPLLMDFLLSSGVNSQSSIFCGDPGTPLNGFRVGSDFSQGKSVMYSCKKDYVIYESSTRTCQNNSLWNGTLPQCTFINACRSNPCHNYATCVNGNNTFTCKCKGGYGGLFCSNDIQPPDLEYCPTNIRVSSSSQLMFINWTEPKFRDPADYDLDVTANYPTNGSTFTWGDYTVVYNALKPFNGLRTTCSFNITVRPHSCQNLSVPLHGALVCNGWMTEYTRVCIVLCRRGTSLSEDFDLSTKYICGGSGKWQPTEPPTSCIRSGLQRRYLSTDDAYFFRVCDENEKNIMRRKYLDILKKSGFRELCITYADLCKSENVDVQC